MFASNIVNSFDHTGSIASPVFLIIIPGKIIKGGLM